MFRVQGQPSHTELANGYFLDAETDSATKQRIHLKRTSIVAMESGWKGKYSSKEERAAFASWLLRPGGYVEQWMSAVRALR